MTATTRNRPPDLDALGRRWNTINAEVGKHRAVIRSLAEVIRQHQSDMADAVERRDEAMGDWLKALGPSAPATQCTH